MKHRLILALVVSVFLSACDNTDKVLSSIPGGAAVATVASDFSSGSHAVISESEGDFQASNNLFPTASDITLASGGEFFYRIERAFAGNNITKFAYDDPQTIIWQYSVKDDPLEAVASNPTDIVVVNEQKAYVIRYGKTKVWIVNPSATTEADFKIGELDLSAYSDVDGVPEMHGAEIVNGKLFITIQRLANFSPTEIAYVAVFDVATDTEIDTNYPGDSLKGIPLEIKNMNNDMVYVASDNAIYIQGVGDFSSTIYSGGIEKIDVNTYESTLVFDDGDQTNHPAGKVTSVAVVSATQAYFIGCADCFFGTGGNFEDYSLYSLNPTTGLISQVNVAELQNTVLNDLSLSPTGDLWISAASATLHVMSTQTDTLIASIDTQLEPSQVVFGE